MSEKLSDVTESTTVGKKKKDDVLSLNVTCLFIIILALLHHITNTFLTVLCYYSSQNVIYYIRQCYTMYTKFINFYAFNSNAKI